MTTEQKLERIRARCVELVAITEAWTPGEWGDAEAGWRSTIAAIDSYKCGALSGGLEHVNTILSAWPDELLCTNSN